MMTRTRSGGLAVAMVAATCLAAARPAAGQQASAGNYGWGLSYMTFAPFVEADSTTLAQDLGLDAGLAFTAYAEHWFGWAKLVGIRLDVLTTRRPVQYPTEPRRAQVSGVGVGGLVRLVGGQAGFMPFLRAGAGLTWYDFRDLAEARLAGTPVTHDAADDRQVTFQLGGGFDIYPGTRWEWPEVGVRLEAADHITLGRPFDVVDGPGDEVAHNLRFGISLQASPVF